MKAHCCWVCLLLFEIVSSAATGFTHHEAASNIQQIETRQLTRIKRQSDAGSILGDIFQIPIQTLSAVSQLFNTAKKQRDKRRPYQNQNYGDNDGGYSTYNNGQPAAAYNNGNSNYNNGNSNYNNNANSNYNNNANYNNNNKFNGAQTAYNNGYNAYNSGNRRPSYNNGNSNVNNIGANAFSKPSSNNYNNNMFNRPFHYLSQYMSGYNNRVSRTHGAIISELSEAADGSSFKI